MSDQNNSVLPPTSPETPYQVNSVVQINTGEESISIGPTSKDMILGGGVLLALTIVFFFVRISFVNYLTGESMKRSPNSAGMAGWGLFGALFFGAVLGCVALVSKMFMALQLIIPMAGLSFICIVTTIIVASKK